jgi:CDP-glucose 4,6-dehydratase
LEKGGRLEVMELKNKKILVTGGAGFIGSHLVSDLIALKNKVVVVDNLSSGLRENVDAKAVFYKADVRDKKIADIFKKENPSVIFHFAAQPLVDVAYQNPFETIEINVMGTVNILEICRQRNNIEAIVVVSSDKAYGTAEALPYTENTALRGSHPYDASKSAADLLTTTYFKTYGMPIVITRFSNVYGPGDTNFSRLIPGVAKALINHEEFLIRSDGKMIREYTYVKDISEGCIALAQNAEKFKGEAFNFGSKNIFNVIDAIKKMEKILGKKVNYKVLNIAKNEIPAQYLDWSKAKKKLGWRPATSFEKGIKETFTWCESLYLKK